MSFDALIFDCDGVLVDSEIIAIEIQLETLGEICLQYDFREFKSRFLGMSDDAFFEMVEIDAQKRLGRSLPKGFRELVNEREWRAYDERLAEVHGAAAFINSTSYPIAVASSGTISEITAKLRKVGLWDRLLPHIFSVESVGKGKPEPDLFIHAAKSLGVSPRRCLVLEDSANGIIAAVAAGALPWSFIGGSHMDHESGIRLTKVGAKRIISNWDEFSSAL